MKLNWLKVLLLIMHIYLCLIETTVYGQQEPYLHINSKDLTFNKEQNTAHFSGQVIVRFEDIILKTSLLKIIYGKTNNKNQIKHIIIPVAFSAMSNEGEKVLIGSKAEYHADKAQLIISGDVNFTYQNKVIKTTKLVYYTSLKEIAKEKQLN